MTERVLPYDPSIVPQQYFWDCGPASTQIALNSRGINLSEDEIIRRLNAKIDPRNAIDEDGTDFVGLLEVLLDQYLPDANYTVVNLPDDPPTVPQVNGLRLNVKRSIDAGYVVIVNWWVPANNRPRGIKGSQSPNYPATMIMHYVTIVGYDDAADAVKIADPGFAPFEYWITVTQLASLITPKAYCYAGVDAAEPGEQPQQPSGSPGGPDPVDVLYRAVPIISMARSRELLPLITAALSQAQCNTVQRIAMWLAQVGHESGGFYYTEELDKGDGGLTERWIYLGRTWIQLTWRSNYAGFSRWCFDRGLVPNPTYFVDNPRELADEKWAGLGAAYFWVTPHPGHNLINDDCDAGDLEAVTYTINGGYNGLEDSPNGDPGRRTRYNQALALGDELLALVEDNTPTTEGPFMALNDDEQRELLTKTREIWDQLRGPDGNGWPQLGGLTPVDALAKLLGKAAKAVAKKATTKPVS